MMYLYPEQTDFLITLTGQLSKEAKIWKNLEELNTRTNEYRCGGDAISVQSVI